MTASGSFSPYPAHTGLAIYGTPRQWADAKIGVIWPRYPIDDQHIVLLCCSVVIDGPNQSPATHPLKTPFSNGLLMAHIDGLSQCLSDWQGGATLRIANMAAFIIELDRLRNVLGQAFPIQKYRPEIIAT